MVMGHKFAQSVLRNNKYLCTVDYSMGIANIMIVTSL